jgi:hypothetical protein
MEVPELYRMSALSILNLFPQVRHFRKTTEGKGIKVLT